MYVCMYVHVCVYIFANAWGNVEGNRRVKTLRENVWEPWGDLPQNCFEPNLHLPQRNVKRQKAILPQNFLIMAEDPKATAVGKKHI